MRLSRTTALISPLMASRYSSRANVCFIDVLKDKGIPDPYSKGTVSSYASTALSRYAFSHASSAPFIFRLRYFLNTPALGQNKCLSPNTKSSLKYAAMPSFAFK